MEKMKKKKKKDYGILWGIIPPEKVADMKCEIPFP
jgi:hypothetical protein